MGDDCAGLEVYLRAGIVHPPAAAVGTISRGLRWEQGCAMEQHPGLEGADAAPGCGFP